MNLQLYHFIWTLWNKNKCILALNQSFFCFLRKQKREEKFIPINEVIRKTCQLNKVKAIQMGWFYFFLESEKLACTIEVLIDEKTLNLQINFINKIN